MSDLPKVDMEGDRPSARIPVASIISRRQSLRCFFSFLFLILTGYFGSIFLIGPLLPLSVLFPSLFCFLVGSFVQLWIMLAEVIISGIARVKIRHFGDSFVLPSDTESNEGAPVDQSFGSCILLLNHRTRLDWLYIWCLGSFTHQLRIVLKSELAHIPGVGWAMQAASFIFLRRKIAVDESRIAQVLSYLLKFNGKAQILMFPEGTDLSPEAMAKSNSFAEKTGRPYLTQTLHPRRTGFEHMVQHLNSDLVYIYDVTVAYPYELTVSELALALGNCPQEVHFYVKRWPVSSLPIRPNSVDTNSSSSLGSWLEERWREKEEMLKIYYNSPPEERIFPDEIEKQGVLIESVDEQWSLGAIFVLMFWSLLSILCIVFLHRSWVAFVFFLLVNFFYIFIDVRYGIGEWLAMRADVSASLKAETIPPVDVLENHN